MPFLKGRYVGECPGVADKGNGPCRIWRTLSAARVLTPRGYAARRD